MRREKVGGCLVILVSVILIPCVITLLIGREAAMPVSGEADDGGGQIRLEENGRRIDLQEYLIGVPAAQLQGDTEVEVIKAQMILNRTYFYHRLGTRKALSGAELELQYLPSAEREARWVGEGVEDAKARFLQAAVETDGLVMTCQRQLAVGMYHRISSGQTRDLSKDYPYIHSVDCEQDLLAPGYLTVVEYSRPALKKALSDVCAEEITDDILQTGLQILEKDGAGYVKTLLAGTEICEGDRFADALGLPSSAFSFQWPDNGMIRIICKGQGHGFGLSQYGASCMAKEGKTAAEILHYYFKNVVIETWKKGE